MTSKTTGSKTIDRAIASDERVAEAYRDSDGYWLYLRPGFECSLSGCHTVHEWNVRDVMQALRSIRTCDCDDCTDALLDEFCSVQ